MSHSVLIVDDSPAMRGFIRRVIVLSGFGMGECLEAGDGVEALDVLRRRAVSVILTDINMPRMNGEQLVAQIEADPALRSVPVVVVSTDSTANRMSRLMEMGARGYLKKPFPPEALRRELERVLGAVA